MTSSNNSKLSSSQPIDHSSIQPNTVRKMWEEMASKNHKAQTQPANHQTVPIKPQKSQFGQQTSPLFKHQEQQHQNSSQSQQKSEINTQSLNKNISQQLKNHLQSYRQSQQPDINILDEKTEPFSEIYNFKPIKQEDSSSQQTLKRTNSQIYRQSVKLLEAGLPKPQFMENISEAINSQESSDKRQTKNIDILDSVITASRSINDSQQNWQQQIKQQQERQKYLLQSSIIKCNFEEKQKQKQKQKQQESLKTTKKEQENHILVKQSPLKRQHKYLILPNAIAHGDQHEIQIKKCLGYIFQQIIDSSYNITPVGYQKYCEDLIMQDKLRNRMKQDFEEVNEQNHHFMIKKKRSIPISVLFTFAYIFQFPIPQEIQKLQIHQFITMIETSSQNQQSD